MDTATSSFIFSSFLVSISANIIFDVLELHSRLSEKDLCQKFSFFNGFTQTPTPVMAKTC